MKKPTKSAPKATPPQPPVPGPMSHEDWPPQVELILSAIEAGRYAGPSAPQRPEELGVLGGAGLHHLAGRGDHGQGLEQVRAEPVATCERPQAAAQQVADDPDVRR